MKPRRAFTLVEILLAVGLLGVLTAVAFPLLTTIARDRSRLADRANRSANEAATLDLLERALLTATGETFEGAERALSVSYRRRSPGLGDERGTLALAHDPATASINAGGTTLLAGVVRFRLRYRIDAEWQSGFEPSARQPFPRAVEIAWSYGAPAPDADDAPSASDTERPFDVVRLIAIPDAAGVEP